MVNKIEIDLKQVLHYSKLTVKSGDDAGKLVLERNLDCMKNWTDEEISEIFNDNGNLTKHTRRPKGFRRDSDSPHARRKLVKITRHHTISALKKIIKEKLEDSELKMPSNAEIKKMARDLISEENIRNAFEECVIVYNPFQIY